MSRTEHVEGCGNRGCATGCSYRQLHDLLDEPLFGWEVRAAERRRARIDALMRGEIPI